MQNIRNKNRKKQAYNFGIWAEAITVFMLRIKGFKILAKRYKTKLGEVDIIAVKKGLVIFVEVKARRDKSVFELVSAHQQRRICKAAMLFIAKNPKFANLNKRFDVVAVYPFTLPKHIKTAWDYFE